MTVGVDEFEEFVPELTEEFPSSVGFDEFGLLLEDVLFVLSSFDETDGFDEPESELFSGFLLVSEDSVCVVSDEEFSPSPEPDSDEPESEDSFDSDSSDKTDDVLFWSVLLTVDESPPTSAVGSADGEVKTPTKKRITANAIIKIFLSIFPLTIGAIKKAANKINKEEK